MKKTVWLLMALLLVPVVQAEQLDYGECKTYPIFNLTCLQTNCSTSFYEQEICAPVFPRINKLVVLDENNPVLILPEYNLSVKISEKTFSEQMTTVLENKKRIDQLEKSINQLKADMDTLNKNILHAKIEVQQELYNETSAIKKDIADLQAKIRNKKSHTKEYVAGFVFVVLIVLYYVFKKGIIQFPAERRVDFETVEPPKYKADAYEKGTNTGSAKKRTNRRA